MGAVAKKRKPGPGRPKAGDEKKSVTVGVRFSADEVEAVRALAAEKGVTLSELLRHLARKAAGLPVLD